MSGATTQVINCPACGMALRVPELEARIRVACSGCGGEFDWAPAPAPVAPPGSSAPAPSRRARVWSGIFMVAIGTGLLLFVVGDDVSPLIQILLIVLPYWGMVRIYRGLRARGRPGGDGGSGHGGMRRLAAVAATGAIVWAASAAGMGGFGVAQQWGVFDLWPLGGGSGGLSSADRRLDQRLESEVESQFEAARAAAAQAATAPARAAAVDAYSEAAATAAFADDLDALERILEEQIAAREGS